MVEKTKILNSAITCDVDSLYECLCRNDDINYKTPCGVNLLMYAVIFANKRKKAKEYIDYLLLNGLDINNQDIYGNTALHLACLKSDLEMVKYLIKCHAYINVVDNNGNNELMNACRITYRRFPDEIKKLDLNNQDVFYLEGTMKIIDGDRDKVTQILADQIEIMKILLDCGIYKEQISNDGYTAMDLAINNFEIENTLMVDLLKSYDVPINKDYKKAFSLFNTITNGGITGLVNDSKVNNLRKMKIKALKR